MIQLLLIGSSTLVIAISILGILLLQDVRRSEAMTARIRAIHGDVVEETVVNKAEAVRGVATKLASGLGNVLLRSGIIPAKTRVEFEQTLASAGLRGAQGLNVFVGSKIFSPIIGAFLGFLVTQNVHALTTYAFVVIPAFAVVGLLMPDWILGRRRNQYLWRVEHGLPDALDMMVICTQAGLSLGPSVLRVAEELSHSYRDLSLEFAQTANELQIMTDSRQALLNLGNRTGVESFKRFSSTLVQTIQYGTPISEALRQLSNEIRAEMLTKFEEKAARLPVMITMPMIIFILPCVFIIAAGPAMMSIGKAFAH
jgi:tight adherence protein C